MSASTLYATASGCSGILSATVSDSHGAATATATIVCTSCSLDVGDSISVELGYSDNHAEVFTGYVKQVNKSQSPTQYEISCANAMVRAVDYFLVSTNPSQPFSRQNIKAENLIRDLMAEAGLTSYSGGSSSFTFMTQGEPLEVNLTSVYDYCKFIADILAWSIWADTGGTIHFDDRPPFPHGDSSVATIDSTNALSISYMRSDRDLRNRVVVYGRDGVYAEAKSSSPYLPSGFYKSVVIAAPGVISTTGQASSAASYNLAKLNRLTIGGSATIIGNPAISCRDCVEVDKSDIGMSGQFYVYGCEHEFGKEGYKVNLDLRK